MQAITEVRLEGEMRMDEYAEWFGARLREALGEMKQVDLVEDIKENGFEISAGQLSHYMQGRRYPDPPVLREIARALDVSADWLLGLTDKSEPVAELVEQLAHAKGESPIDKVMKELPPSEREQVMGFAKYLLARTRGGKASNGSSWDVSLNVYQRKHGALATDDLIDLVTEYFPGLARLMDDDGATPKRGGQKG